MEPLKRFWNELGLNQKVTIVLSVVGIFALMIGLLVWASQPKMQLLHNRLDESDMAGIVELLESKNEPFEVRGSSLFVRSERVDSLRMEVAREGLVTGGSVGFEIFDEGNFGVSDFVQRTNKQRAMQGNLERSIETIKGVRNARVMLVMPKNRLILDKNKEKPTASVTIDTGGHVLENKQVIGIQKLVSSAVPGLQASMVSVIDNRGYALSDQVNQDGDLALASGQTKYRLGLENEFANKIHNLLEPVVGRGNVNAKVSLELDFESTLEEKEIFDPESQVARMEETEKENSESSELEQDPVVGVEPNVPTGLNGQVAGKPIQSRSETGRNRKKTSYEISRVRTTKERKPGKILQASAAIFINQRPAEIGEGGVKGEITPRTSEEIEQIRIMVANAIGVSPGQMHEGGVPAVTVTEIPFTKEPIITSNGFDQFIQYLKEFQNPLFVLVAIVLFGVFLSMLKRHKPAITPIEVLEARAGSEVSLQKSDVSPRPTPELLNDLIQERPENVAQALKSWSAIK